MLTSRSATVARKGGFQGKPEGQVMLRVIRCRPKTDQLGPLIPVDDELP
jgi:hypothetical protein